MFSKSVMLASLGEKWRLVRLKIHILTDYLNNNLLYSCKCYLGTFTLLASLACGLHANYFLKQNIRGARWCGHGVFTRQSV